MQLTPHVQVLLQLLACPPDGILRADLKAILRAGPTVGRAADSDALVPAADVEVEGVLDALEPWLVPAGRSRCDSLLRLEHAVVRRAARRRYDSKWDPGSSDEEVSSIGAAPPRAGPEPDRNGYAWVRARVWSIGMEAVQVFQPHSRKSGKMG
jgi:hypothetical protein